MNHTPERLETPPPAIKTCAWCMSMHVADAVCSCDDNCGKGWCPVDILVSTDG